MTHAEELWLREMYDQDTSFAYECSADDLDKLLALFGEMEPIVDAINVNAGVGIEQRSRDIGCRPEDFGPYESDDCSIGDIIHV